MNDRYVISIVSNHMQMLSENDSGTFRRIFSDFIVYTYWAVKVFQILN